MSNKRSLDQWVGKRLQLPAETITAEQLLQYQLGEIRNMIDTIKQTGHYYKESLADVSAQDIQTLEDFQRLPLLCEEDLIDQEWKFQCVGATEVKRIVTVPTTGTTGQRKRIRFAGQDLELAMDFAPYGFSVMCQPGDKVVVMMSGDIPGSIGENVRKGIEPFGMQVRVFGPVTELKSAADFLLKEQPDVIVGIPIQMLALARFMELHGYHFSVKSILLSSDDVPDMICKRLQEQWNAKSYRHYGMTEMCMFGALECGAEGGYHLRSCDHFFEVLNPDEDGFGELAVTTFHHRAMPLLRYKTGDIGKMTYERCACGSVFPRIASILGRKVNQIRTPKGPVFIKDIEEFIFAFSQVIDFECVIDPDGDPKQIQLQAICLAQESIDMDAWRAAVKQEWEKSRLLNQFSLDLQLEYKTDDCLTETKKKKIVYKKIQKKIFEGKG